MREIGPPQYKRLVGAVEYYERCGYKYIDVPWAVSEEAILLTRPPHITSAPLNYRVDYKGMSYPNSSDCYREKGKVLCPVASAEQSFLQLALDERKGRQRASGKYVAITPCFRNEPVLDDLHQPYFMKVELINWSNTTAEDLSKMIADARLLFEEELWVDAIENTEPDPLRREKAYDLITTHTHIELGSYGIREHGSVGRWLFGTGLAEPRYSYAVEKEAPFNQKVETFF